MASLLTAIMVFHFTAYAAGPEDVAGEYSGTRNGSPELRVKVEKTDVYVSGLIDGKWTTFEKLTKVPSGDNLMADLGNSVVVAYFGKGIGLIKLKPNAIVNGNIFPSEYWLYPICPVYKIK